jgi:MFS family permease
VVDVEPIDSRDLEDPLVSNALAGVPRARPQHDDAPTDLHRAGAHSRWRATFASLRIRNFRLFAASQLLSNSGAWMQRIAQDWLVLTLTNSPMAVGVTTAMQFAPMLLFGLLGGVIADRYPKRRLLLITQSIACLLAFALAALSLSHVVTVWQVWVIAFFLGLDTVVDNPTRQLFVNEMVGPRYLRNAISLNSSVFQLGGLVGPAVSGVLINAVGGGWAFAINAVTYLPVIATLLMIDRNALTTTAPAPRAARQLREGLAYVRARPRLVWPIVLVGFVGSIGLNMPIVLSAYAKNVFHNGASGYGLFNSMIAFGSMAGALRSAGRPNSRLRSIVAAAAVFGSLEAATSMAPSVILFTGLLIFVGAAALTFLTAANATVQTDTEQAIRGRVMSLYMMVLIGGTPIGGPLVGWVTERVGVRAAMFGCGIVPALAALVIAAVIGRRAGYRLRVDRRFLTHWPAAAPSKCLGAESNVR